MLLLTARSTLPARVPPPRRLLKIPYCFCGKLAMPKTGFCRSHYKSRWHSARHFGGLRDSVLHRDGAACQGCGKKPPRLNIHHRSPGVNQRETLITLCPSCHASIHRMI